MKQLKLTSRRKRRELTEAESLLWKQVRARRLNGYKVRRRHMVAGYEFSFYCARARLLILIDRAHESLAYMESVQAAARERGYSVALLTEEAVLIDPRVAALKILDTIREAINALPEKESRPWKTQRAIHFRKNPTPAEARLWAYVRGKRLGFRVLRQKRIIGYIADFYCAQARLVIEVDGSSHEPQRDRRRDAAMEKYGFHILRLRNAQVMANPHAAVAEIRAAAERAMRDNKERRGLVPSTGIIGSCGNLEGTGA